MSDKAEAANGREAIQQFRTHGPGVTLMVGRHASSVHAAPRPEPKRGMPFTHSGLSASSGHS